MPLMMMNMDNLNFDDSNTVRKGKRMIALDYYFKQDGKETYYQLICFSPSDTWNVILDGAILAKVKIRDCAWSAIRDGELSTKRIEEIGRFIESQHFNNLPGKIKAHWRELVEEVEMLSDEEYIVICKASVDFFRFERLFTGYVSQMVEEEWPVVFRVFDADFSVDFIFTVNNGRVIMPVSW